MRSRFDIATEARDSLKVLSALDHFVTSPGIDEGLLVLIDIRTSQINRCALSVQRHSRKAHSLGKSEQWITLIGVWRSTAVYNPVERAVLEFAELLAETREGVPKEAYDAIRDFFVPRDIARLVIAAGAARMWNQLLLIARKDPRPNPVGSE